MWYRGRNTLQNPALLYIVGKQIFCKSSGPSVLPETGQKQSASGERLPGHRGPRPPVYLMDVVERNSTDPSCESDLKANPHPSSPPTPSLASRPVRVDKQSSLSESPVAVSTNMPALEPTHVPVKPVSGQNKSGGHCFLPETEEKTSVSGVRPPGHRGAWSPKRFMEVSVKNIIYPSCESDLNVSADPYLSLLADLASRRVRVDKRMSLRQHPVAVSTNMPVSVKVFAGQKSVSDERPPGHRGPRLCTNLIDVRNIAEPSCESDLQAIAHLSLPRLPSLASRPVKVDKRISLCERPVAVSTNMSVLEITCVPVKPVADPQKRGSVVVARNLTSFQSPFHDEDVKMKRAQPPKRIHPLVRRFAFAGKKPDSTACTSFKPQTLSL